MPADNLQIRVTADISNLQSQMKAAAASVRSAAVAMTAGTEHAAVGFQTLETAGAQASKKLAVSMRESSGAMEQHYQRFFSTMGHGFTRALNGWLLGTQTFGQAFTHLWQSLAMGAVQEIEKIGLKWVATHLLMAAANAVFHTQESATQAAALAEKQAMLSASNVMQATGDAGLAAAGTFAWWSGINPIVAPEMAAAAYAEGMGWTALAAFDLGGVVPRTQVALVHGGERVLTSQQNTVYERIARGGATPSVHIGAIHVHGATDPEATANRVADIVTARVKRQARDWGKR